MPSDTLIYRDGRRLRTSRRAYEGLYKPRGWRLRPQRTPSAATADGEQGDQPDHDSTRETE